MTELESPDLWVVSKEDVKLIAQDIGLTEEQTYQLYDRVRNIGFEYMYETIQMLAEDIKHG